MRKVHPLTGPREKLKRAEEQIKVLNKTMGDFLIVPENRYQIVIAERDFDGTKYVLRARGPTLPDEWGVLVGEIAHNLRSALDSLVYVAALQNRAPKGIIDTQFPVFLHPYTRIIDGRTVTGFEGDRGAKAPSRTSGRRMIQRLSPPHQAIIEGLQPYKRGGGGRMNKFFLLQELSNADKHRLIQTAGGHTDAMLSNFTFVGSKRRHLSFDKIRAAVDLPKRGVFLDEGARVGTIDALVVDAEPDLQLTPLIGEPAFYQGCPAVRSLPVRRTLNEIGRRVADLVWRDFAPDFRPFPAEWFEA